MRTLCVACLVYLLACGSQARARPLGPPPTEAQLRQWAADECVTAGKRVGIDYSRSLERAIHRDSTGLTALLRFTTTDGFIGAAAESHCSVLLGLLQRWGDSFFAPVLRAEKPRIRKAVIDAIDYSFPHPGWRPSQFPQTYSLATHEHAPKA